MMVIMLVIMMVMMNTHFGIGNRLAVRPTPHAPRSRKNNSCTFGITHSIVQGYRPVEDRADVQSPWGKRCQEQICTRQVLWRCLRNSPMALVVMVVVMAMAMVKAQVGRVLQPRS